MLTRVPQLLCGLIDDAALLPPVALTLPAALSGHQIHRGAWYADLVGPLLIPASRSDELLTCAQPDHPLEVGIVADAGPAPAGLNQLTDVVRMAARAGPEMIRICQLELSVAMRGQDPSRGMAAALTFARQISQNGPRPTPLLFAEIPLTRGMLTCLDDLAAARQDQIGVAPKFRTGGLAVELFPTPMELAAVICACWERELPFKLTCEIHRAVRRTDPETGLVNHGFLNVLAALILAGAGAETAELAEVIAETDSTPLVRVVSKDLEHPRPLLHALGGCGSFADPLSDLRSLGLLISVG